MKNVRIAFAVAAITLASASVFANSLFVDQWYRSAVSYVTLPTTPTPDCNTVITTQECFPENAVQCTIPAPNNRLYIVSVRIDDADDQCELAKKAN
jgi:hypothetical protein